MEDRLYQQLYMADESQHWWFMSKKEIVLHLLESYIDTGKYNQIFDLACGSGLMLKALDEYGHVTGVDICENAINYSRIVAPHADLILGDLTDDNILSQKSANIVLALDMLEHVQNDQLLLERIYQLLKYDGTLLITVPAYQFLWSNHDDIHNHFKRYTKREINVLLKKTGFHILKSSYYNCFLFVPAFIVRLWKKLANIGTDDFTLPPTWLNRVLKFIFSLEKYWLKIASFPFGLSVICIARKH